MRTVVQPVDWGRSERTLAVAVIIIILGAAAIYYLLFMRADAVMPIPTVVEPKKASWVGLRA